MCVTRCASSTGRLLQPTVGTTHRQTRLCLRAVKFIKRDIRAILPELGLWDGHQVLATEFPWYNACVPRLERVPALLILFNRRAHRDISRQIRDPLVVVLTPALSLVRRRQQLARFAFGLLLLGGALLLLFLATAVRRFQPILRGLIAEGYVRRAALAGLPEPALLHIIIDYLQHRSTYYCG
jgi:hypothetical protein